MDHAVQEGAEGAQQQKTLNLQVRYVASKRKYEDSKASKGETLAQLKPVVLAFYGLQEGPVPGGTKTYNFALNGTVQADLSLTLGKLADGKEELKLDLIERFEQG